jgi:predicted phosphoadenosine phosphosulfate sulfurtransferase
MRSDEKESLVETMDKYEKIMKRIATHRSQPMRRMELKIEGTLYTHMDQEEFLREFTEWLEREQQGSRFIGQVQERG